MINLMYRLMEEVSCFLINLMCFFKNHLKEVNEELNQPCCLHNDLIIECWELRVKYIKLHYNMDVLLQRAEAVDELERNYQKRVEEAKATIQSLQTELKRLRDQVKALNEDKRTLEVKCSDLKENIDNLAS